MQQRLQSCRVLVLESNHDEQMLLNGPYPWPLKQRVRSTHGHLSNRDAARLLSEVLWPGLEGVFLAHLSETNNFDHTNSILGTGVTDFRSYLDKVVQLGIEENCRRLGEPCVAGIEMGARGGFVDDPEHWVQESLEYLAGILPEVGR